MNDLYSALPGYPGGKRRLLPAIGALTAQAYSRSEWSHLVFADAFLGGGSVSLWAKAMGFHQVLANDLAERSALIGRALIANSTLKLKPNDVLGLCTGDDAEALSSPLLSRVESPILSGFLGRARTQILATECDELRDLLTLVLLHVCIHYFPMGLPSASDAVHVAGGDFDRVSGSRLKHYLARGRSLVRPESLLRTAARVNSAVLPGLGAVTRLDAFEFLRGVNADFVYLDPPYAGTQSYERAFELIDDYLGVGDVGSSAFSSRRPPLDELIDSCGTIPWIILSLNNTVFDEQELSACVGRHRKVERVISLPFRHYASVATAAKNAANREILILASRRTR